MKSFNNTEKRKNRALSALLFLGVFACIAVILGSLYVMYRPFTMKDVLAHADSARTYISGQIASFSEMAASKARAIQTLAASLPGGDTDNGSLPAGGEPGADTPESVPCIENSGQLGSLSDLDHTDPQTLSSTYVVMLDTGCGPMLYYHQGDSRWGDFLYGGSDRMSRYGCGPTAVAMIVNTFSGSPATPVDMAQWASEHGYYAPHGGSYHSLIPDSLAAYGLQAESVTDYSYENAAKLLSSGHILVALMGRGTLTANGHFVLFTKLLDNGNVCIADPASYENCMLEWDLEQLLLELKKSYDNGGPLWAVQP